MPTFETFKEFKSRIQSDTAKNHHETLGFGLARRVADGHPGAEGAVSAREFDKMQKYVNKYYRGVDAEHSFLDAAGNHVDCIPFEQQASVRAAEKAGYAVKRKPAVAAGFAPRAAAPAARRRGAARGKAADAADFGPQVMNVVPPLRAGTTDLFGNRRECPPGCVPVRRVSLKRMARQGTFDAFFRKRPAPATPKFAAPFAQGDGFVHHHALVQCEQPGVRGVSTWLNVWQADTSPGSMSLSQLWVKGESARGVLQTVESGWQVDFNHWQTDAPVLFVYFNPHNYDLGGAGYLVNPGQFGFVQTSSDWVIGSPVPGPYSTRGGAQIGLRMQWQTNEAGDWILFLSDAADELIEVGYFPGELYAQGGPSTWTTVQFGGEVANAPPRQETGQMGSGSPPTGSAPSDFGQVAFQRELGVQTAIGADMESAPVAAVSDARDAPYRAVVGSSNKWGSYVFFGG